MRIDHPTRRNPPRLVTDLHLERIAPEPAEIQRATQAIADALAATIAAAPEQWYSFKPLWPATEAEQAALAARASTAAPLPAGS